MSCYDIIDGPSVDDLSKALFYHSRKNPINIVFQIKLDKDSQQEIISHISDIGNEGDHDASFSIEGRTACKDNRPFIAHYSPETKKGTMNFFMEPSSDLPPMFQG